MEPWAFALKFETTGLDRTKHHVLEVGVVVLDSEFSTLCEYQFFPSLSRAALKRGDRAALEMHIQSGLLERRDGALQQVHETTPWHDIIDHLDGILKTYCLPPPLLGHSPHFEREWLNHVAPELKGRLLYQNLDARPLQTLAPDLEPSRKSQLRRALPRLQHSIAVFQSAKKRLLAPA